MTQPQGWLTLQIDPEMFVDPDQQRRAALYNARIEIIEQTDRAAKQVWRRAHGCFVASMASLIPAAILFMAYGVGLLDERAWIPGLLLVLFGWRASAASQRLGRQALDSWRDSTAEMIELNARMRAELFGEGLH